MMRTASLRLRLTLIILVPLLTISAAVAIWAGNDAQARAADRFDRSLLVTALGISRDTAISGGDALSSETRDLLRNTSGGPVFYHVYAPDGVFVTGYATPPVPPPDTNGEEFAYFDADYHGARVRAVRFTDRMDVDNLTGDFTFTVWQNLSLRDGFVRSLSGRTYFVMSTLLIAVALTVWFGVRLGLAPLTDLEHAIARRSAEDLTPIARPIPQEVRGIVGRLNTLLSDMAATMRAKDSFISDAAHQLRNPIAGVLALSQAVAASRTPEDLRERSDDLIEAASHAARLSEDLLAFERARSAPPPDQLDPVDIVLVVERAVARHRSAAMAQGVQLREPKVTTPIMARVDSVLLGQAVENLLVNALKHGGAGLSRVTVELRRKGPYSVLSVSDDGQGLAPDQFEMALSRFGQGRPGEGSGLGLPIASAVAEAFGGRLLLNGGGGGLTVVLELPVAEE
ncbi:sensor histidine kinase [Pontivivens ytuae]|uniref:histidine kinase n=1 Tax=Pontivivens ytuae TaxID=2789856 RepID=A0A7S9LQB4_9RHOB|nr:sensor histidine kinase [Pontivivens ytuae]QPH53324.1 sensor histidine kinase [Pontivivens ytuae]